MKQSLWTLSILALALAVTAGCKNEAPGYTPKPVEAPKPLALKSETDPAIIPLKKGATWVYRIETESTAAAVEADEISFSVADTKTVNGNVVARVEVKRGDKVQDVQVWRQTPKGLYQDSMGVPSVNFTPPQPIYTVPLKDGSRTPFKSTGITAIGTPGVTEGTVINDGKQTVETGMGRMEALAIRTETTFRVAGRTGKTSGTTFIVPGTGIVRYLQSVQLGNVASRTTLVLKEYKPGA